MKYKINNLKERDIEFVKNNNIDKVVSKYKITKRTAKSWKSKLDTNIKSNVSKTFNTSKVEKPNQKVKSKIKKQQIKYIDGKTYEISVITKDNFISIVQDLLQTELNADICIDSQNDNLMKISSQIDISSEFLGKITDAISFHCTADITYNMSLIPLSDTLLNIEIKSILTPFIKNLRTRMFQGYIEKGAVEGSYDLLNRIYSQENSIVIRADYINLLEIYKEKYGINVFHILDMFLNPIIWNKDLNVTKYETYDHFDNWFHIINFIKNVESKGYRSFDNILKNTYSFKKMLEYFSKKYNTKDINFDNSIINGLFHFIFNPCSDISTLQRFNEVFDKSYEELTEYTKIEAYHDKREAKYHKDYRAYQNNESYFRPRIPNIEVSKIYYVRENTFDFYFEGRDQSGLVVSIWYSNFFYSATTEIDAWAVGGEDEESGFIFSEYQISMFKSAKYSTFNIDRKDLDNIFDTSYENYIKHNIKFTTRMELLQSITDNFNEIRTKNEKELGIVELEQELAKHTNSLNFYKSGGNTGIMNWTASDHDRVLKNEQQIGKRIEYVAQKIAQVKNRAYIDMIHEVSNKLYFGGLYSANPAIFLK